jgi:hypothetical protein
MSQEVEYTIAPVPDLTTAIVPFVSPQEDYAGGDYKFNLTVSNSSQATAAAEDVVSCVSLSGPSGDVGLGFDANNSTSGFYVNDAGDACINTQDIGIGAQATAKAIYGIPYVKSAKGGGEAGTATFCATAENGFDEDGKDCSTGNYGYDTNANPIDKVNSNAFVIEPNKRRVGSGHHVRYEIDLQAAYAAGPRANPQPLFDARVCHRTPKGLRLDGANRRRDSLRILDDGQKVCSRKAGVPAGAARRVVLRYEVRRKAPRKIGSTARLTAAGIGKNAAPVPGAQGAIPEPTDHARVTHRRR